jgi:hypothetical protein
MKKFTVDVPIVGWASVEIELDDNATVQSVLELIENDELTIDLSIDSIEEWFPVLDLNSSALRKFEGAIPMCLEVSD